MTRIALLRHAETEWNAQGRVQGQANSPLTPVGVAWAEDCARNLAHMDFTALYASPLGRAQATVRIVGRAMGLEPRPEPALMEQSYGAWTGHSLKMLREMGFMGPQMALGWACTPPVGESRQEVLQRSWQALVAMGARHPGETVLAVTHEGVVRCIAYVLLGRDFLPQEPTVLVTRTLLWLRVEDDCLAIEAMNQPLAAPPPGRTADWEGWP
jgi:broad specificity phosphatase PhoE